MFLYHCTYYISHFLKEYIPTPLTVDCFVFIGNTII